MRKTDAKKPAPVLELQAGFSDSPKKAEADAMARLVVRPSANAAVVMAEYSATFGEQNLASLMTALCEGMDELQDGEERKLEDMLYAQAHALQAMFMNLARRAAKQEFLTQWEAYMRAALKAQSQCRMTLETLATIRNPPTVFARQANFNSGGQQQVNNGAQVTGAGSPAPAHARETQTEQNRLLEVDHGQRLDFGAQSATCRTHPEVAPVGTVNRAEKRHR